MLQQTRVAAVIPYFERFIQRFPNIEALARASMDEVLGLWAGLGYYARARNLKRAAGQVVREHGGRLPEDMQQLQSLPGIGRSSAGAILSFACGQRHPILDGNAKRVLARCFTVAGWPGQAGAARRLWQLAEACTPQRNHREYNQAIMDLGALLCRRSKPRCTECPLVTLCQAARRGEQQRYPGRRAARPLPLRRCRFLILEREDGSILLTRRAPSGVWGGLWCLPEIPGESDVSDGGVDNDSAGARRWVARQLGFTTRPADSPPSFYHCFSHYRLQICPLRLVITGQDSNRCREHPAAHRWYNAGDEREPGLPAPIKTLLQDCVQPGKQPAARDRARAEQGGQRP